MLFLSIDESIARLQIPASKKQAAKSFIRHLVAAKSPQIRTETRPDTNEIAVSVDDADQMTKHLQRAIAGATAVGPDGTEYIGMAEVVRRVPGGRKRRSAATTHMSKLLKSGQFRFFRLGRRVYVHPTDAAAWVERYTSRQAPSPSRLASLEQKIDAMVPLLRSIAQAVSRSGG